MRSALLFFVGVVVLASGVGCDGGTDEGGTGGTGPKAVGTSGSTGTAGSGTAGSGTSTAGSTGTGGSTGTAGSTGTGGALPEGVPLTIAEGWVDASMSIGIQGAVFSYADPTSLKSMMEVKTGASYCISGTAAKVDKTSPACVSMMFTAPGATDCYGEYWGAAIGMNLNQAIDMTTMMGGTPMPFDGSKIKGFAFEITGTKVPTTLRFKVEGSDGEFCSPPAKPVLLGANTFNLTDVVKECWKPGAATMNMNAETIKASMVKIAWQVVTKDTMEIPFDYCVTNVRALQ